MTPTMTVRTPQLPAREGPDLAIQVRGLRKSFGEVEVLTGVDLDVAPGSVCGIL